MTTIPAPPPGVDQTTWLTMSWWQRVQLEKRLVREAQAELASLRRERAKAGMALLRERAKASDPQHLAAHVEWQMDQARAVLDLIGVDPDADQHMADLLDEVGGTERGAS